MASKKKEPSDQIISFRVTANEKEIIKKAAEIVQEHNPDYVETYGFIPVIRRMVFERCQKIVRDGFLDGADREMRQGWLPEAEWYEMLEEQRQQRQIQQMERTKRINAKELPEPLQNIIKKEQRLAQEPEQNIDGVVIQKNKGEAHGVETHIKYMFINGEEVPVKVATLK